MINTMLMGAGVRHTFLLNNGMGICVCNNWPSSFSIKSMDCSGTVICINTYNSIGTEDIVSMVEDSPSHQWLLTHKDDGSHEYLYHKAITQVIHACIVQEGIPLDEALEIADTISKGIHPTRRFLWGYTLVYVKEALQHLGEVQTTPSLSTL